MRKYVVMDLASCRFVKDGLGRAQTFKSLRAAESEAVSLGPDRRVEIAPLDPSLGMRQCAVAGCAEHAEEYDRREGKYYRYCELHSLANEVSKP